MRCDSKDGQRVTAATHRQLGPITFLGNWEGYAHWGNMEWLRDSRTGLVYAKNAMRVRAGTIATLSIAPAYRDAADFVYARDSNGQARRTDVVRIRACERRRSFQAGGVVVRDPTCVLIRVRERGSRRVHQKMISLNMGSACPAP